MKNSFKFLTGRENPFLEEFEGVLIHKEITTPLQKLKDLAKKEIGADLQIISGNRNYERQEVIWNLKAS
jgi:hypothetical protein